MAREDKGLLGKEWNKSDKTFFKTASYKPTVPPEEVANYHEQKEEEQETPSVINPQVLRLRLTWLM